MTQPQDISNRLNRLTQAHVVSKNTTEAVGCQIGQELEPFHLIRTQGCLKFRGDIRLHIDFNLGSTVFDSLPGTGIKHFRRLRIGQLHGMHAVSFSGKIERIQTKTSHCIALVVIQLDFQTHPSPIIHTNIAAASGNKSSNLFLG